MRLFNRIALLAGIALFSGAVAQAADNGCGCSTGDYSVTCCNPQEKKNASCTVYVYDEDGNIIAKAEVEKEVEIC